MPSFVLDLWPFLCRWLLLLVIGLWPLLFSSVLSPELRPYYVVGLLWWLSVFAVLAARRDHWTFRLVGRTRHFHTLSASRVVLRYAPELHGRPDIGEVLDLAEKTLALLEGRFGRLTLFWHGRRIGPLLFRSRVYVYLFPTVEAVQEVFGERYGGIALTGLHAIVFPFERVRRLEEWLRHELSHLFDDRWNPMAPPLFAEGLATWLQWTEQGSTINALAVALIRQKDYSLRPLLKSNYFFLEKNHGPWYVLAGSFSGFLIRRFGWDTYKRFYCRLSGSRRFDARFSKHFGSSLEEAEEQWRGELRRMYKAPLPSEGWACRFE